jgi:hypothetical protein
VLSQIATGVNWKFPVLSATAQLDNSGDALRQAIALYFDAQPVSGDNITLSDGTTVRTYQFGAGGDVTVTIGADTNASMTNLAAAITADGSGDWDANIVAALDAINDGSGTSTSGRVIVIYRAVQIASQDDRMYGTWGTQANVRYVTYAGEEGYEKTTSITLPTADPATKTFGPGTLTAALLAGEAHVDLNADQQYIWNADTLTWVQISGTGSITAGDGLTKTGDTLDFVTGDTSLTVAANSVIVKRDSAGAITLDGGGAGIEVNVEAAGSGTGGLVITSNAIRVNVEAAGSGTGGLVLVAGGIRVNRDTASTGATASVLKLSASGLGVGVDDSTVEGSAAGGSLRVKDLGITTAKIAADAVTIAKLGISFREETFAASAFTLVTGDSEKALAKTALVDVKSYAYVECYRNGIADMTRVTTATDPSTADEFRITSDGLTLEIGTDITGTSNNYRARYLSADLTA